MARGDQQRAYEHFDPLGVFSTVLNNRELRLLFGCAAHSKWHVRQSDISQAFTYGDLDHDLYLFPPEGSPDYDTGVVWKCNKSLYGFRQSQSKWKELIIAFFCNELGYKAANDA